MALFLNPISQVKMPTIREFNVGAIIEAKVDADQLLPIVLEIVGWYQTGEKCVAWNGDQLTGRRMKDLDIHERSYHLSQACKNYTYYAWLHPSTPAQLYNPIIAPDQVCSDCKLPAPHTKPNLPEDKFQCVSCKVLSELQ